MRIVVTGATSFIGLAVTKELLRQGHDVFAVVRPGSPGRKRLEALGEQDSGDPLAGEAVPDGGAPFAGGAVPDGGAPSVDGAVSRDTAPRRTAVLHIMECTLDQIGDITSAPELSGGADGWLHLGWEGAGSANRQNPELQARNIGYALDALRTASRLGCGRFLFSGSQAEYGIYHSVMKEDGPCNPVSEYGKDKLKVCLMASEEAKRLGITYLHARIFSVYGPGDHPWSLISTCMDTFLRGGHMELGACTQMWNFLYITDTARALAGLLLAKAPAGVYNVAGDDTRPLKEYIEELHRLCGGGGTYEYGKRPPNAEGVVSLMPDTRKLSREAGFVQTTSFDEGIREMLSNRLKETDR